MKTRQQKASKKGDFFNLARREVEAGRAEQALPLLLEGMSARPADQRLQKLFIKVLRGRTVPAGNQPLLDAMTRCLANPKLQRQHLLTPWISLVQADANFKVLMQLSEHRDYDEFTKLLQVEVLHRVMTNRLIMTGLAVFIVPGALMEYTLTHLRRYLVMHETIAQDHLDFLASLALNCFYNEYLYEVSAQEQQQLVMLLSELSTAVPSESNLARLILLGCYQPLFDLEHSREFYQSLRKRGGLSVELLERQIGDRLREAELVKTIPAISRIDDAVSLSVRGQYEENPYPRWQSWPVQATSANRHAADSGIRLLNAGCGTGQSTVFMAAAGVNVEITAIDLSLSSLAFGKRQAEAMGLSNIKVVQADILELGGWSERFDAIASGGVLHHLENPEAGWSNLVQLLQPGGVMRVGLYSELGRQAQVAARRWIKKSGLKGSIEDIRHFRRHVFAADQGDPVKPLENKLDFYSLSNCRDLVFHVMEHRYTCLLLQQTLDRLELRFLGFCHLAAGTRSRFLQRFPDQDSWLELANWQRYEEEFPDSFAQMYHFYCCRKGEVVRDRLPQWMKDELRYAQSFSA